LISGRAAVDRANREACGFKMVQADYFRVLGIQIVRGRPLTGRDVKGTAPVAVINQAMAGRYFANQDPIAQRILVQEIVPGKPALGAEIPWEVVGVIADEHTGGLEFSTRPVMYVPLEQSPSTFVSLVVRAEVDAETLSRAIGTAVHEIDRTQAVTDVRTLDQLKSESAAPNRLRTGLLATFAALALLLSGVGIYGVISYTVAQRTREIGVRAALGASSGALLRMVLTSGMGLAVAGLALGLVGALALTRVLGSLLSGVGARDPLTMTVSAVVLTLVALLACYVPARRAAKLDPISALRDS
ncbi:MAG: FtsX-like permease family protein, partial [Vicinamibacterales bacterium]